MSLKLKADYWLRSALNVRQERRCPCCGGTDLSVVDHKYIVTWLLECRHCHLRHRHPKDDPAWLERFYQKEYTVDTHMITKLPDAAAMEKLKAEGFPELRDISPYIKALRPQAERVLDYGCSWGYHVFKMRRAGLDAEGFELSRPRAAFGQRTLGVTIHSDPAAAQGRYDVISSSHVIEHLASIPDLVTFCRARLVPGGLFMAFCPNGSDAYRRREPGLFHVNWGSLHPNYLDIPFARHLFREVPHLILTGDWTYDTAELAAWDQRSQRVGTREDGKELLIIAVL